MKKVNRSIGSNSNKARYAPRKRTARLMRRLESTAPLPIGTQQILMGLAGFRSSLRK